MQRETDAQKSLIRTLSLKRFIVFIIVAMVIGFGVIESRKIYNLIEEARELIGEERYIAAVGKLKLAQKSWIVKNLGFKEQEVAAKIKENEIFLEGMLEYERGIEEFNKEKWQESIYLFSKVLEHSFYYQEAETKIKEAKEKILEERFAEALYFDGDDYIDYGSDSGLDITDEITIEAWVKPNKINEYLGIVNKPERDSHYSSYYLRIQADGVLHAKINQGAEDKSIETDSNIIVQDVWQQVVFTYDGSKMKLYVNGIEEKSKDQIGPISQKDTNVYIGMRSKSQYFNGFIDEVRIYSRSLLDTEIQEHYDNVFKNEDGLILYLSFEEGNELFIPDGLDGE